MNNIREKQWNQAIALATAYVLILTSVSVNAQGLQSTLTARRDAIM